MVPNLVDLYWAHYSYLGLDPNQLTDKYANYWDLNSNHTKINYLYAVANPKAQRIWCKLLGIDGFVFS
jgi:hypothetical protein